MKLNNWLLFFAVMLLTFSCKKDAGVQNNNNNNNNTVATPLLSKLYILDTTMAAHDTLTRLNIFYDAQGRISQYTNLETQPNGDTLNDDTFIYLYNGNDSIAWRTILQKRIHILLSDHTADTTDFVYDNGNLVYDSTYTYDFGIDPKFTSRRFTYHPGLIEMYDTTVDNSAGTGAYFIVTAHFYPTSAGSNIVQQVDSSWGHSLYQQFGAVHDENIVYQDNPNPLYALSKPMPHKFLNYYYVYGFRERDDQPNLMVSSIFWNNGDWLPQTYTYTLRADGFPSEAHITRQAAVTEYRKYVYIYQ